eukprot:6068427-Alexandrium_andersonii.AAC.1
MLSPDLSKPGALPPQMDMVLTASIPAPRTLAHLLLRFEVLHAFLRPYAMRHDAMQDDEPVAGAALQPLPSQHLIKTLSLRPKSVTHDDSDLSIPEHLESPRSQ